MASVVNTGFDPIFGDPLRKFLAAANAQGLNANIISGVRTDQDQRELQANAVATRNGTALPYPERGPVPVAAPPGSSAHEFGLAADVQAANPADQGRLIALGQKMGLAHPMSYDPTHFEAPGWRQVAANQAPSTPWDQVAPSGSMLAEGGEPISTSTPGGGNFRVPGAPPQPSRPVSATPIPGGGSHADFIRAYAQKIGLDPNLALGIANAEGLRAWSQSNPNAASTIDVENGKPFSFGDFQLNIHPGAMGAQALAANIDPRDPNQWQAADQFALDQMKAKGVGAWSSDPVAKAYLASGKVPALPAMPASTGTSINTTGAPATGGGTIPGFGTKEASDQFTQGLEKMGLTPGQGKDGGSSGGAGASGDFDQPKPLQPSPMIGPAPEARNVAPPMAPAMEAGLTGYTPKPYGQTLNSFSTPLDWGSAAPGSSPYFDRSVTGSPMSVTPANQPAGFAGTAGAPTSPQGTTINSLQQLQMLSNPAYQQMVSQGYGGY